MSNGYSGSKTITSEQVGAAQIYKTMAMAIQNSLLTLGRSSIGLVVKRLSGDTGLHYVEQTIPVEP